MLSNRSPGEDPPSEPEQVIFLFYFWWSRHSIPPILNKNERSYLHWHSWTGDTVPEWTSRPPLLCNHVYSLCMTRASLTVGRGRKWPSQLTVYTQIRLWGSKDLIAIQWMSWFNLSLKTLWKANLHCTLKMLISGRVCSIYSFHFCVQLTENTDK